MSSLEDIESLNYMLTFLRKIRRSLIESGSTRKYAMYAIGEILLVMIGILLALQVNNWNEFRKTKIQTNNYKQKLINDLIQDTMNVNALSLEAHDRLDRIDTYFKFFKLGNYKLEEVLDSSLNSIGLNPYNRYFPINYTFSEMQSSGNLQLLPEHIRRLLMELSNRQEYLQIIIDRVIADSKNERYERDKYWDVHNIDFFEVLGFKQEELLIRQGLLHQHNFLKHIENLSIELLKYGIEIKSKSSQLISLLEE